MILDTSNNKYELTITREDIRSTDSRFTMSDLSLGDNYKFIDVYFENSNGEIVRRTREKGERRNSNQVLPRLSCQIFEKDLVKLFRKGEEKISHMSI